MSIRIRAASHRDYDATRRLVVAAFHDNEPEETAEFLDAMRAEGCIVGEWLSEDQSGVIGHIVFSRVWIASHNNDRTAATMLTPLAVRPDRQREGLGTSLMMAAIKELESRGEAIFLVLGHPAYYPRAGFSSEVARGINSPWGDEPAFMARSKFRPSGMLVMPQCIAEAH